MTQIASEPTITSSSAATTAVDVAKSCRRASASNSGTTRMPPRLAPVSATVRGVPAPAGYQRSTVVLMAVKLRHDQPSAITRYTASRATRLPTCPTRTRQTASTTAPVRNTGRARPRPSQRLTTKLSHAPVR